ncbi:hypothetical protein NG799_26490 [Laspinema sp. D1]|uniref:Uncharacterized protein n=1 Tax=Laspinema palackyanum D2a TaxID=2953684 RepID=A0ABT2MYM7_9CYAN|nr:hypothetical protein [Laspinema sp. D2a]
MEPQTTEWRANPLFPGYAFRGHIDYIIEFGFIEAEFIGEDENGEMVGKGRGFFPLRTPPNFVGAVWTGLILWQKSQE